MVIYDALLFHNHRTPCTCAWKRDIFQPPIHIWKPLIGSKLLSQHGLGQTDLWLGGLQQVRSVHTTGVHGPCSEKTLQTRACVVGMIQYLIFSFNTISVCN